jgi:hypothetical protein
MRPPPVGAQEVDNFPRFWVKGMRLHALHDREFKSGCIVTITRHSLHNLYHPS